MKTMKKLFALLLALAMVLSMAVTVSAAEGDEPVATALTDTGVLTLRNATAGYDYHFYRILDIADISPTGQIVYALRTDADGAKWAEFIANVTIDVPVPGEDGEETTQSVKCFEVSGGYVNIVRITSDVEAQKLAEKVVAYAKANNIASDFNADITVSGDYTSGSHRQYGYYIMARDKINEDTRHTVFTLRSANFEIQEKNSGTPTISKYVQEDSEAVTEDSGWKENTAEDPDDQYNVAEIEQPVTFKIVINLKAGNDKYVITDTMANFESIENVAFDYSGGVFDQSDYTWNKNDDGSNMTVTSGFVMTLTDDFRKTIEDNQTLTITYTAKLKPDAIIGGDGNKNEIKLEYGPDGNREVASDETYTKTYKLHVAKVDENDKPLNGATFELYREGNDTPYSFVQTTGQDGELIYTVTNTTSAASDGGSVVTTLITPRVDDPQKDDDQACFHIHGLDTVDKYILKEVSVPTNYVKMDDLTIIINTSDEAFDASTQTYNVVIKNLPGVTMPTTGGMGTTVFYAVGGILVLAAVALLITKKRMSV